jgi:hypothetical protein
LGERNKILLRKKFSRTQLLAYTAKAATLAHRLGRVVQRPRLPTSAAAATGGCLMAVEKTLRLESTKHFPLFHRHDDGC